MLFAPKPVDPSCDLSRRCSEVAGIREHSRELITCTFAASLAELQAPGICSICSICTISSSEKCEMRVWDAADSAAKHSNCEQAREPGEQRAAAGMDARTQARLTRQQSEIQLCATVQGLKRSQSAFTRKSTPSSTVLQCRSSLHHGERESVL